MLFLRYIVERYDSGTAYIPLEGAAIVQIGIHEARRYKLLMLRAQAAEYLCGFGDLFLEEEIKRYSEPLC